MTIRTVGKWLCKGNPPSASLWFIAGTDEPSRVITRTRFADGNSTQFYDYASLFNAKAFALKETRAQLWKYLDVPGVWRGDLFCIQNLVATLKASDSPGR